MENKGQKLDLGKVTGRLIVNLSDFVERASKEGAAPAEVEALPGAARVLSNLLLEIQDY